MGQKYPKLQWEYEDDKFRRIAERQERLKTVLALAALAGVATMLLCQIGALDNAISIFKQIRGS